MRLFSSLFPDDNNQAMEDPTVGECADCKGQGKAANELECVARSDGWVAEFQEKRGGFEVAAHTISF